MNQMLVVYPAMCHLLRFIASSWGGAMPVYISVGSTSWCFNVQLYQYVGIPRHRLGAGCGELPSIDHSGGSN